MPAKGEHERTLRWAGVDHGLPPHPDPSAPAAAVGHDSRRVVNRCAFAQSAWDL